MSHATGHDAPTGAGGVRVDLYAAARGEKVDTVRKRIQRGHLAGYKGTDHRWYVVEELTPLAAQDTTGHDAPHDATYDATRQDRTRDTRHDTTSAVAVNPSARAQLEAVRDEWLAPLIAQITEQAERIGRLEAERDGQVELLAELRRRAEVAEAELDGARLRLAEVSVPAVVVVAGQETTEAPRATATTPAAHRPAQRLWQRLRQRFGGG